MKTIALIVLSAIYLYDIFAGAVYCGEKRRCNSMVLLPTNARLLIKMTAIGVIEVVTYFYLAHATKSSTVLVGAWVSLSFNLIGFIIESVNYGRPTSPRLWLVWPAVASDAALFVLCIYGYTAS